MQCIGPFGAFWGLLGPFGAFYSTKQRAQSLYLLGRAACMNVLSLLALQC